MPAPGMEKEKALRDAGFGDSEIDSWKGQTQQDLSNAGFSGKEVQAYFGVVEPNMEHVRAHIQENLNQWRTSQGMAPNTAGPPQAASTLPGPMPVFMGPPIPEGEGADRSPTGKKGPKPAATLLEAIDAGWQMSTANLLASFSMGKAGPDTILPEDAPRFYRIASNMATLAGDIPAMVAGAVAGGVAGGGVGTATLPVIGTVSGAAVGASGGAFALPAGMRRALMSHYERGDIKDFKDFWERSSAVMLDSLKGFTIGAATAGVGGVATRVAGAAAPLIRTTSVAASEIATMVTVGKALEGQAPNMDDFIDAAIMVGGLKGATHIAGKMRTIYQDTGVRPEQVAQHAMTEPTVRQELVAPNVDQPAAYKAMRDPSLPPPPPVEAKVPSTIEFDALPEKAAPSEAQAKILSQVGAKAEPESGSKLPTKQELYKDFVDRLDPIKTASEHIIDGKLDTLKADENPYILSRMASDYKAKAKHFFERGTLDFKTLAINGKGLKEIIEPHVNDLDGFAAYLISKRVVEVEGRGITSGFDVDAAREVVKAGRSRYDAAGKEMVDFQNRVLQYAKDSGLVSGKSYEALVEAGKAYLPLSRVLNAEEIAPSGKQGKSNPLKALRGSEKKIQNPFLSVLDNTETLMRMAEKNRAVESFVRLAAENESDLIKKVPAPMRPIEISENEVAKLFEAHGLNPEDAEPFTIFRAQNKDLAENEFQVFRNGKREVYATDPILAQAFKALDGDKTATSLIFKMARGLTAIKKIGVTFTPDFIARNFFRDQLTAGTFTKGGAIPFTHVIGAMGDLIQKNDTYYNWLKAGGANGTFLEMGERYLNKDLLKLNEETSFMDAAFNIAKKPVEWMRIAGELTEQATRLAEAKRVMGGASSGSKVFEGGFASREVTVDFQRIGAKMSALNAITAFQNVSIQGLDRTFRAVKDDPMGVSLKAAAYITVPSVLLWWANKDDPRWKAAPRWEKDMFWFVMTKDTVFRIPKPQELGILFGSVPERMLEKFFTDNPKALTDFESTMQNLVTPSLVPDALVPGVEQYFNRSMFTGHPIVPNRLEKRTGQYQYTEYTSETAKQLGKLVASMPNLRDSDAASPARIDALVTAWGGNLGRYAVQLADQLLTKSGAIPDPVKPDPTLADYPFIKAFVVRYPSANAQQIQDFYDRNEKSEKTVNTIHALAKEGDVENALKEMQLKVNNDKLIKLDGIKGALGNMSNFIRLISNNKDMSPTDKRQQIDALYLQMIRAAELGNTYYDELEKALKE